MVQRSKCISTIMKLSIQRLMKINVTVTGLGPAGPLRPPQRARRALLGSAFLGSAWAGFRLWASMTSMHQQHRSCIDSRAPGTNDGRVPLLTKLSFPEIIHLISLVAGEGHSVVRNLKSVNMIRKLYSLSFIIRQYPLTLRMCIHSRHSPY